MVVFGQILGQLETGKLIVGDDPADEPGRLQVDEVAVGRASRQIGEALGNLGDTHRIARRTKQSDDGAPAGGITLIGPA